ncbi:MAG: hypothetical protein ACM3OO_12200 [Planctomycetaceae bacterium]
MRRISLLLAVALMLATVPIAHAASGTDPNDVTGGLDVSRSSVRAVERTKGVFRVRLHVETYDRFDLSNGVGSFYWQLDTRGGSGADYQVFVFGDPKAVPAAPLFCLLKNMKGLKLGYMSVTSTHRSATCGIPRHLLHPTKDLRWRVAGRMQGVVDRAPDTGWYGG